MIERQDIELIVGGENEAEDGTRKSNEKEGKPRQDLARDPPSRSNGIYMVFEFCMIDDVGRTVFLYVYRELAWPGPKRFQQGSLFLFLLYDKMTLHNNPTNQWSVLLFI